MFIASRNGRVADIAVRLRGRPATRSKWIGGRRPVTCVASSRLTTSARGRARVHRRDARAVAQGEDQPRDPSPCESARRSAAPCSGSRRAAARCSASTSTCAAAARTAPGAAARRARRASGCSTAADSTAAWSGSRSAGSGSRLFLAPALGGLLVVQRLHLPGRPCRASTGHDALHVDERRSSRRPGTAPARRGCRRGAACGAAGGAAGGGGRRAGGGWRSGRLRCRRRRAHRHQEHGTRRQSRIVMRFIWLHLGRAAHGLNGRACPRTRTLHPIKRPAAPAAGSVVAGPRPARLRRPAPTSHQAIAATAACEHSRPARRVH